MPKAYFKFFKNINFQKHFENFFYSEMETRFKESGIIPKGGQYSGKPSMGGLLNSVFHTLVDLSSTKMQKGDLEDLIVGSTASGMVKSVSADLFGKTILPKDNDQLFNFTFDYYKPAVVAFSGLEYKEVDFSKLYNRLMTIRDFPHSYTLPLSITNASTPSLSDLQNGRNF